MSSANYTDLEPHWSIGVYEGKGLDSLVPRSGPNPIIRGSDFASVRGIGVADPFCIRYRNEWYVFFELFLKDQHHAVIAACRSSNLVDWDPLGIVLRQSHHLSYPFVFEHDGEIYMMQESKAARQVNLYRAKNFPFDWEFDRTILRGRLMDCSIVYHAGRYWMFAGWRSYWLRLFYSPHPFGPWQPHWLPVARKYSRSFSRPGGRPVQWRGKLVRFTQDNLHYYGQQLRAMHVTVLNRLWFSEKSLYPRPILQGTGAGWNARCMHHIDIVSQSADSVLAIVDGCE